MSENDEQPLRRIWSKSEKQRLLAIIKADGFSNYERIAESFPNKSAAAIKAKINKYKVLAKSLKPGDEDPLDFWLHSFFTSETDTLLPKALLFIQLFEDHPSTEEANGIDFGAIYGFLHRLTLGHAPSDISPESWKAFDKEMWAACAYVTNTSEREVLTYLSTFSTKQKPAKDYSRKNRDRNC